VRRVEQAGHMSAPDRQTSAATFPLAKWGPSTHDRNRWADLRAAVDIVRRQHRREDLPGAGIHAGVQLPPGRARAGATFLDQPLARSAQPQARTVDPQVSGLSTDAGLRHWHLQVFSVSARSHSVL